MVLCGQDDRDQFGGGGDGPLAHPVERAFAVVGEGCQRVEPEHRARALQRVQTAEHRVDQRLVAQPVAEIEQPAFDLLEQFLRLDAERGDRILVGHRPSTLRATLTS